MYIRKYFDVEQYHSQTTFAVEEPLVTQAIKSSQNILNTNQKYHQPRVLSGVQCSHSPNRRRAIQ